MSCGCTIVGSANAPVNEVIVDDVNGCLVPFFETQGLVDKIQSLLSDPQKAQRLGLAARQTVLDKYDVRDCTKQWKALILRTIREDFPVLG